MDAATYDAVSNIVAKVNSAAKVLGSHYTKMDEAWWNSLLTTAYDGAQLKAIDESTLEFESFAVKNCCVDSPVSLIWILQIMLYGVLEKLYVPRESSKQDLSGYVLTLPEVSTPSSDWMRKKPEMPKRNVYS